MISSFRRYLETWYVRGFFMLMVGSFILWGVGDMLRVIGTSSWVAKVGGTAIETQTLEHEYRRALQTATRDLPPGQEASADLRRRVGDQTLQRLIGQAAMGLTLHDLRIVVPDTALAAAATTLPVFKGTDGKFDRTRLERVLRENGLSEAGFLELLRGDLARKQLLDAVSAAASVSESEALPIYGMQFEKRSADIAAFPVAAEPEPAAPDEPAARRWYDNHKDQYLIPEYRRANVIVLSPMTLAAAITITDADVQAAYEQHLSDFTTIAKRSAQVISAPDETKAATLADQWRAGADWAAVQQAATAAGAAAITQDNAPSKEYPDPDLAKAVFAAKENTVIGPVRGALGWFVVRVTGIVEGGVAPFDQVKDKVRERAILEKSLDLVYDRANKIDGQIANGATLDTLPGDLGVPPRMITIDDHGTGQDGSTVAIPGEAELREAVTAAVFATQKGEPPHLTEVQTPSSGGSGYFALTVEDIMPAAPKPFETVRAAVEDDWRADQRRHAAEQAAAAMMKAVKDGKAFSDAARDAGVLPVLSPLVTRSAPGPVMPPEVQQVLFTLKKGEPTMVETAGGFLVATPVEIVAPDAKADPAGYAQMRQALARTVTSDLGIVFEEALRQRGNPRINQTNLDQMVQP